MKKIIHISDLHFGRENKEVVEVLLNEIRGYQPTLVIVSGDLTQRARKSQFMAAGDFLKKIQFPKIVVPGNHDIPLFDLTSRFLFPLDRYKKYITDDFFPTHIDESLGVIGINSAFAFTWKSGRVTQYQLQKIAEKFKSIDVIKILVVHHPSNEIFNKIQHYKYLQEIGIDLILSGHLHQASVRIMNENIATSNLKTLVIQAGTAVSTRLRRESNSFNLIEIHDKAHLTITVKGFEKHQFKQKSRYAFRKKMNHGYWRHEIFDVNKKREKYVL